MKLQSFFFNFTKYFPRFQSIQTKVLGNFSRKTNSNVLLQFPIIYILLELQSRTSISFIFLGEIMVCVLDFKREVGLWHSMLASVFNGMHVVFIPYALMKVNPASWMQMVTKHRATVAVCKSRDLHWGLLATKDHR